jgi:hypothetical protein
MLVVSRRLIPFFATFFFPIDPPKRVIMYHMTSRKSAMGIMRDGFDPKRARTTALALESMCHLNSKRCYGMLLMMNLVLFFAW